MMETPAPDAGDSFAKWMVGSLYANDRSCIPVLSQNFDVWST